MQVNPQLSVSHYQIDSNICHFYNKAAVLQLAFRLDTHLTTPAKEPLGALQAVGAVPCGDSAGHGPAPLLVTPERIAITQHQHGIQGKSRSIKIAKNSAKSVVYFVSIFS